MKTSPSGKGRLIITCDPVSERAVKLAEYITCTGATVRGAAAFFGVSKSTVHKDICSRLQRINPALYRRARAVLEKNKSERHLRGGLATRRKYRMMRQREK